MHLLGKNCHNFNKHIFPASQDSPTDLVFVQNSLISGSYIALKPIFLKQLSQNYI